MTQHWLWKAYFQDATHFYSRTNHGLLKRSHQHMCGSLTMEMMKSRMVYLFRVEVDFSSTTMSPYCTGELGSVGQYKSTLGCRQRYILTCITLHVYIALNYSIDQEKAHSTVGSEAKEEFVAYEFTPMVLRSQKIYFKDTDAVNIWTEVFFFLRRVPFYLGLLKQFIKKLRIALL